MRVPAVRPGFALFRQKPGQALDARDDRRWRIAGETETKLVPARVVGVEGFSTDDDDSGGSGALARTRVSMPGRVRGQR